jgi:hypothetical protein
LIITLSIEMTNVEALFSDTTFISLRNCWLYHLQ